MEPLVQNGQSKEELASEYKLASKDYGDVDYKSIFRYEARALLDRVKQKDLKIPVTIIVRSANCRIKHDRETFTMGLNDINSLSHSKWDGRYHIVFAPQYRRRAFCRQKRLAIGKTLRQLCEWKGVKIIAAEACPDHIHLFVEIPPKYSLSGFMGDLKGKSAAMMYEQFGGLRFQYEFYEFL